MAHLVLIALVFATTGFVSFAQDSCGCKLETTSDTRIRFNQTLTTRTRFLYLKLHFLGPDFNTTEFAYLRNTLDVIDPLTWVLSIGGNGRLLLQSPFDFKQVSLGTLSASGVGSIDVDIIAPDDFTDDISDEDRLCSIVDFLYGLIFDAIGYYETTTGNMLLPSSSLNVCLERQSAERRYVFFGNKDDRTANIFERLSESGHGILQSTVEYHCWTTNETTNEIDMLNPVIFQRDRANWCVRWLLNVVSALIVLFLPWLFFKYFDWQNPPKGEKIRIDTRPYPFGFFHFVFYSTFGECDLCSLSCWLRSILFFLFMTLFCCIQFLPVLYVDPFNYNLREHVAERLNVWKFGWRNSALTCYSVIVICLFTVAYNFIKIYVTCRQKKSKRGEDFYKIGRSYLTVKWLFPEKDDKGIVEEICPAEAKDKEKDRDRNPDKDDNIFIDSPNLWNLLNVLGMICKGGRSKCAKPFLVVIAVFYWMGQAIPLIYYPNIVVAIMISLVHYNCKFSKKTDRPNDGIEMDRPIIQDGMVEEGQKQRQKIQDIIFIIMFLIVSVVVSLPVFFQMFVACSHLIEVVGYTLVGLIVNAKYVVSWIAVAIGVLIFLVQTVTGYSNSYVTLFYEVFDVCEESRFVSRDNADGVPQMDLKFFFRVAYKVKPWKTALFWIYVQLVSAAVFILLGCLLLYYVDGLNNLNDLNGQSELFGAVVIGGILPIAKLLTAHEATVKCREKAKRCKLEAQIDRDGGEQSEEQWTCCCWPGSGYAVVHENSDASTDEPV